MKTCKWLRAFDGHFNISCCETHGNHRANGNFKKDEEVTDAKWDFTYCPYCSKKIEVIKGDDK